MIYDMQYESINVAWFIRHCGLGLICFGLGLTENFWPRPRPRPHTFCPRPRPYPSLASLTSLLSIHVTFTAIVPGVYPGEAKICLSWLQKLTHVPSAIAILLVICCCAWSSFINTNRKWMNISLWAQNMRDNTLNVTQVRNMQRLDQNNFRYSVAIKLYVFPGLLRLLSMSSYSSINNLSKSSSDLQDKCLFCWNYCIRSKIVKCHVKCMFNLL